MRSRIPALVITAALVIELAACGRPVAATRWYDFETASMNDPVTPASRWRAPERDAVTKAAAAREREWERAEERAESAAAAAPGSRNRTRWRPERGAGTDTERDRERDDRGDSAGKRGRRPVPVAIASNDPDSEPHIPAQPERPVLGNGSVASELVAGARRVLGMQNQDPAVLLKHLLTVAAVDLRVTANTSRFVQAVWDALRDQGVVFSQGPPKPGDLAFLDGVDGEGRSAGRLANVAVVESIDRHGVATCIGPVHGVVTRFRMDPSRPAAVRDERAGVDVNTPLRQRSLSDRSGSRTLAGELFAGYARPR